MMLRILKWIGVLLGAFILILLVLIVLYWEIAREMSRQLHMFSEPHFDTEVPVLPELPIDRPVVLSFSKTNGFRHYDAIPAAQQMLEDISAEQGWFLYATENNKVFEWELLQKFDLVVLNNSSGDLYTADQRASLRRYLDEGGGLVAMHAAGGDSGYDWEWYVEELIRAQFVDHPISNHIQSAELRVRDPVHGIVEHLPSPWVRSDEWYNFEESPSDRVRVLLDIDESSYDPERSPMGEDHPLVWVHQVGEGRVFYSALGHTGETYLEDEYRELISRAMEWALATDE